MDSYVSKTILIEPWAHKILVLPHWQSFRIQARRRLRPPRCLIRPPERMTFPCRHPAAHAQSRDEAQSRNCPVDPIEESYRLPADRQAKCKRHQFSILEAPR